MAERTTVRKAALGPGCYREPDRFGRGNLAPAVGVRGGGLRWPRRRMAWGRICSETFFCRFARGFIFSILPSSMALFESRSGLDNAAGDRKPLRVSLFRLTPFSRRLSGAGTR